VQILHVSGIVGSLIATSCVATGVFIQPLNHSVVYLKEREVILTNDFWRVVVDFRTAEYEDVIATIHEDLLVVERQRKEFTSVSELRQIEILLNDLESRLYSFKQVLPKLDKRRGLINLGGNFLRFFFWYSHFRRRGTVAGNF